MPINLSTALQTLENLAPLCHAEAWDNVGLLVEAGRRHASADSVHRILLTIDLTDAVLDEAISSRCELIVSYHPPIFKGIQSLTHSTALGRRLIRLLEHGISVYSPHTALDAARGGVNDWLIGAFGPGQVVPITQARGTRELKVVVFVPEASVDAVREGLARAGAGVIGEYRDCSFNSVGTGTFVGSPASNPVVGMAERLERVPEIRLEMVCPASSIGRVQSAIAETHPYEEPAWDVYSLVEKPLPGVGMGRELVLTEALDLPEAIARVKKHLGLARLRVATAPDHDKGRPISRIAVCAGAGGSVLRSVSRADLILSGELRHHDILAWLAEGTSVIVCDHTNTERGYLRHFAARLGEEWGPNATVLVAQHDRDPLRIV